MTGLGWALLAAALTFVGTVAFLAVEERWRRIKADEARWQAEERSRADGGDRS